MTPITLDAELANHLVDGRCQSKESKTAKWMFAFVGNKKVSAATMKDLGLRNPSMMGFQWRKALLAHGLVTFGSNMPAYKKSITNRGEWVWSLYKLDDEELKEARALQAA